VLVRLGVRMDYWGEGGIILSSSRQIIVYPLVCLEIQLRFCIRPLCKHAARIGAFNRRIL
jgi:hypothetical protein